MTELDHATLVRRAVTWLRKTERCRLVFADAGHQDERADAIGWKDHMSPSILVEVKADRRDFERDREKLCRRAPERGLGVFRWYLAPPDLIDPSELPACWGLLEPRSVGSRHELYRPLRRVVYAGALPANLDAERKLLFWKATHGLAELERRREEQPRIGAELTRLRAENARMAQRIIELQRQLPRLELVL